MSEETKDTLMRLLNYCHTRVIENHKKQQVRFIGGDIQAMKCLQSRASEAAHIRDEISRIMRNAGVPWAELSGLSGRSGTNV